ncbi:hypothetical protein ABEB36_002092 [Hypothenemus hampei]|uniref:DNA repair protein RAD51 homolog 3 n=1 Tax=Hypothenemus hampei TaxID=57062 RepID=A0ABD1F748_HYPHA
MEHAQNITTLNIARASVKKLQNLGKHYCNDLTESDLLTFAINLVNYPETITGLELLEEELSNTYLLSLNTHLDAVLTNEISPGRIVELAGIPGTGKTQICFQLCVTAQLPTKIGGCAGQVIYLNTNKNFSVSQIRKITNNLLKHITTIANDDLSLPTEEEILKNIFVFNVNNVAEMFAALLIFEEFLNNKKVKLVIIDNITSPLNNIENQMERKTVIHRFIDDLQSLSRKFHFAVIITNNYTTKILTDKSVYVSALGDSFFDRVNTRICLSRHPNNLFEAELIKSTKKTPLKMAFALI